MVEAPEQQAALARMRSMRAEGAPLRAIAEKITSGGVPISFAGVRKVLAAAGNEGAAA